MKFYLDITIIPNPEIGLHFLWAKVYQQIHLGLVEIHNQEGRVPIGLSFPEYNHDDSESQLGSKVRVFAEEKAILEKFDVGFWMNRLTDYVHFTSIRPVPVNLITGYAIYRRMLQKNSKEHQARRYSKRHGIDYETALLRYEGMQPEHFTYPFVRLQSMSNHHQFPLFIKKTEVTNSQPGVFSKYGLSPHATVPIF